MHPKRVIIFGTGNAGENYIHNNKDFQVIAASDNNPARWGNNILGIPIIEPTSIIQQDFDFVVITSTWAKSIEEQLICELGVSPNQIKTPPKASIKADQFPFEHLETKQIAHQLIQVITAFFSDNNIIVYADFGTLLGICRDGEIINWDDDIDFAVNDHDFTKATSLASELYEFLPNIDGGKWNIEVTSQEGLEVSILVKFISSEASNLKSFHAGIARRKSKDNISEVVGLKGMLFAPAEHFDGYDVLKVFDTFVYTPKHPEAYLGFVYGDWKKPKKNMSFSDYENIGIPATQSNQTTTKTRSILNSESNK